jgi:hypothetical protein
MMSTAAAAAGPTAGRRRRRHRRRPRRQLRRAAPPPPQPQPHHPLHHLACGPLAAGAAPTFSLLRTPSGSSAASWGAPAAPPTWARDTTELVDAALRLPPLPEDARRAVVGAALSAGEEALLRRIRFRFDRAGVGMPRTRVAYSGLTVARAAAAAGGAGAAVPTAATAVRDALRAALGRGRAGSVTALESVTGVLRWGAAAGGRVGGAWRPAALSGCCAHAVAWSDAPPRHPRAPQARHDDAAAGAARQRQDDAAQGADGAPQARQVHARRGSEEGAGRGPLPCGGASSSLHPNQARPPTRSPPTPHAPHPPPPCPRARCCTTGGARRRTTRRAAQPTWTRGTPTWRALPCARPW